MGIDNEVKLNINSSMTNEEIIAIGKKAMNGEYITYICKKCGRYRMKIEANTDNCEIKEACRDCFED